MGYRLPSSSGLPLSKKLKLSQLLLKAEKIPLRPQVCFNAASSYSSHLLLA